MDFTGMHTRFLAHRQALLTRIEKVIDQGRFVLGPEVAACEQALANFIAPGAPSPLHTITCASGTDALRLALMALDIGPGHAVVVPAFGFAAAAEAVVLAGATPIFADIDPFTFNLAAADVTRRLRELARDPGNRPQPRALIAIDTFGLPADYQALAQVAREFDLHLIEDAAQSMGASHQGRKAGCLADLAVTSFYPTKTLGCMGDGGAVFTSREDWAERLRSLRDHGQIGKYWHAEVGLNSRLDSLQAAVLLEMLPDLAEEVQARARLAKQYRDGFQELGMVGEAFQDGECLLQLPSEPAGSVSAWSCFTVLCSNRESLREHLQACGIPTACHYPRLLPESPAYAAQPTLTSLPVAEQYPHAYRVSRHCLSLPMHGGLSLTEREQVIEAVGAWSLQKVKAGCP